MIMIYGECASVVEGSAIVVMLGSGYRGNGSVECINLP